MKDGNMSVGWINNFVYHSQDSYFGQRLYRGSQHTYYSSLLYQWSPGPGKHTIDAGLSYKYDHYNESLDAAIFDRKESVPGAFLQYTYSDTSRITLVAGIRSDYHNLYGNYITPRIHLKYLITPAITLRASAGKGYAGRVMSSRKTASCLPAAGI